MPDASGRWAELLKVAVARQLLHSKGSVERGHLRRAETDLRPGRVRSGGGPPSVRRGRWREGVAAWKDPARVGH